MIICVFYKTSTEPNRRHDLSTKLKYGKCNYLVPLFRKVMIHMIWLLNLRLNIILHIDKTWINKIHRTQGTETPTYPAKTLNSYYFGA